MVRFALQGLGTGGVYSVLALGLVLVYRASGVLNFAAGAIGALGAFLFFDLRDQHGWNPVLALIVSVAAGAAIGVMSQVLVMARIRGASALSKLIATLGILTLVQGVILLLWGSDTTVVSSVLPTNTIQLGSSLNITEDRLILILGGLAVAVLLKVVYSYTKFGLATSAVAQNRRAAASSGISASRIEVANWAIGGGLSALALIAVAGIIGLSAGTMVLLVLPAIAAALIGRFSSFLLTVVGAMIIGVIQGEFAFYVQTPGLGDAVPFLVIIAVIVAGGSARPTRLDLTARLPLAGSGKVNRPALAIATIVAAVLIWTLGSAEVTGILTTIVFGILIMSVVVVTGYGGQLSLAQFALAGLAAWSSSRLVASAGLPFWAAGLLGIAATVPLGLIVALPALRTRGVNLAIVTLGLAEVVVSVLLNNASFTGGLGGTFVGTPKLFGIDFGSQTYPARYATLALVLLVLCGLVAANVRRGTSGRRLLAVRSDERAAASIGIGVYGVKLYAFGVGAAIAGVAGVLLAFQNPVVVFTQFDVFTNISLVMYAVIGGIGWLLGAPAGALLAAGSLISVLLTSWLGASADGYLAPISGFFVLLTLIQAPEGVGAQWHELADKVRQRLGWGTRRPAASAAQRDLPSQDGQGKHSPVSRTAPTRHGASLELRDLSVRFGGVQALNAVSLQVAPGEVVGLVGPNGAGKTTLIDTVTGFTRAASGQILLDGRDITGWAPTRISRAGIARSFQSVQLFEAMTVRDNLLVATDASSMRCYASDLVGPRKARPNALMEEVIAQFRLDSVLDALPSELPHGIARLAGVARALLSDPRILLLDEPAAGLDSAESAELGPMIREMAATRSISVLLVEHDVPLVLSTCDRVVVLDFGKRIAVGVPEEIRRDEAVVAAYLGTEVPDGSR